MIITRTPLRISLLGGGTDMPAFYSKHKGAVVSFTIDKYVYVMMNPKFDGRFRVSYSKTETVETLDEIEHSLVRESLRLHNVKTGMEIATISDLPGAGTGLGSSSAVTVGLMNALEYKVPPSALAERAWTVEAEKCFNAVGKQDHYASAHGGLKYYEFHRNYISVHPIPFSEHWIEELQRHSLLLWTGISRSAADILKEQRKNLEGDPAAVKSGQRLAELAEDLYDKMLDANYSRGLSMYVLATMLNHGWQEKQRLGGGIGTEEVNLLYAKALHSGAWGGKLLGAGGGGFLYFIAPPDAHQNIIQQTNLRRVDFKYEPKGSEVVYETKDAFCGRQDE